MVLVMGLCICGNYLQETNLVQCIISKVCINYYYLNDVRSRTGYKTIPEAAPHFLRFFAVKLMFFLHNVLMVSGGSVSCIATDDSRPRPGAVAVAGDNQLLVFLRSEKSSVH